MKSVSLFLFICTAFLHSACSSTRSSEPDDLITKDREKIQSVLNEEVSLSTDRKEIESLRSEIPEETRRENDELAFITELMAEPKTHPSRLRQRYQYVTQKKREDFRRKVKKLRDDFKKEETKRRGSFLKIAQEKRSQINPKELDRKEVQQRYKELDEERREFFSSERDRRKNFESELNAHSKDFNDEMRMKGREFSDQITQYTRRYNAYQREQKEKSKVKRSTIKNEFEEMRNVPSEPLEP